MSTWAKQSSWIKAVKQEVNATVILPFISKRLVTGLVHKGVFDSILFTLDFFINFLLDSASVDVDVDVAVAKILFFQTILSWADEWKPERVFRSRRNPPHQVSPPSPSSSTSVILFAVFLNEIKFDQIGRFLIVLGNKFANFHAKVALIFGDFFGYFEKKHF